MNPAILLVATVAAADWSATLNRAVPDPTADYVAIDLRSGQVIASRWPDLDRAVPVGSLVKPFTALAWTGPYPTFDCQGTANRCWRPKAHGRLAFSEALAQSCNAYFLQLAAKVKPDSLRAVTAAYRLPGPANHSPEALIGLGTAWRVAPLPLLRAYAELVSRAGDPRVDPILVGLREAAQSGTATAASGDVWAKTGTAPCLNAKPHAGDGFAIVLSSTQSRRFGVLVRAHNAPGASAANLAGRLMRSLESSR